MKNVLIKLAWGCVVLIGVLISGCDGQLNTEVTISGTFVENDSGDPIEGAIITGFQENNKGGVRGSTTAGEDLTDTGGNFQLQLQPFTNSKASDILLIASVISVSTTSTGASYTLEYALGSRTFDPDVVIDGDPFLAPLRGNLYGYVEVTVKNDSVPAGLERVEVKMVGIDYEYEISLSPDELNSTLEFPVRGGQDALIGWQNVRADTILGFVDTIFVVPTETMMYTIDI